MKRATTARVVFVAVDLGSAGDDGLKVQHDHAFRGQFVQCPPHGGVFSLVLQTKSVQVGQYLPAGELAGGDAAAQIVPDGSRRRRTSRVPADEK
jgi:hypothetical protein